MNQKLLLTAAVLLAYVIAGSVASAGELVSGGVLAPLAPSLPAEISVDAAPRVAATPPAHAYVGKNLFGNYEGILELDRALDVLSVEEHAQTRLMRAHGDLLGAQRLLLRGIARGLGHIWLTGTQEAPLGTLAVLAGYYIALAGDCELPTAPIEAAFDKSLQGGEIAPSEAGRYKWMMIQSRLAFTGAGTVLGCLETQNQIAHALGH
jgi:hypothetical protein